MERENIAGPVERALTRRGTDEGYARRQRIGYGHAAGIVGSVVVGREVVGQRLALAHRVGQTRDRYGQVGTGQARGSAEVNEQAVRREILVAAAGPFHEVKYDATGCEFRSGCAVEWKFVEVRTRVGCQDAPSIIRE